MQQCKKKHEWQEMRRQTILEREFTSIILHVPFAHTIYTHKLHVQFTCHVCHSHAALTRTRANCALAYPVRMPFHTPRAPFEGVVPAMAEQFPLSFPTAPTPLPRLLRGLVPIARIMRCVRGRAPVPEVGRAPGARNGAGARCPKWGRGPCPKWGKGPGVRNGAGPWSVRHAPTDRP